MNSCVIPYEDKYIIYRPLLRLAFVANAAMVNLIDRIQTDPSYKKTSQEKDSIRFLEQIGYFDPDPSAPEEPEAQQSFKPTIAVLLLTNACNFRCIYCYASAGEARLENLSVELGQRAIEIVSQNAIDAGEDNYLLGFHGGGEPTMAWDNMKSLVNFARSLENPCKVQLTTNGFWTESQSTWILNNIDEISLSFDGMPTIQNRQRPLANGKGTFDPVIQTIHKIDHLNKPYGIRMTVTEEGIDDLPQNIEFLCKETGCPTFQVEPAFKQGRALRSLTAVTQNQRFSDAFMEAWRIGHSQGKHIYYSGARPWAITSRFCQAPEKALIVGPDGFLTACYEICSRPHDLAEHFIFANSLEDIRFEDRNKLLQMIAERRKKCKNCFCYWHCAGDCPSKTFTTVSNGHLVFGERCELNRTITKELIVQYIAEGNGLWRPEDPIKQVIESC